MQLEKEEKKRGVNHWCSPTVKNTFILIANINYRMVFCHWFSQPQQQCVKAITPVHFTLQVNRKGAGQGERRGGWHVLGWNQVVLCFMHSCISAVCVYLYRPWWWNAEAQQLLVQLTDKSMRELFLIALVKLSELTGKHCTAGTLPRELCCSVLGDVLLCMLPSSIWHTQSLNRMDFIIYLKCVRASVWTHYPNEVRGSDWQSMRDQRNSVWSP